MLSGATLTDVLILDQILADAMGLGKTVMTISLIVSNAGRGGVALPGVDETGHENPGTNNTADRAKSQPSTQMRELKRKHSSAQKGGGTLIVCPMTLLGQWKVIVNSQSILSTSCLKTQYVRHWFNFFILILAILC